MPDAPFIKNTIDTGAARPVPGDPDMPPIRNQDLTFISSSYAMILTLFLLSVLTYSLSGTMIKSELDTLMYAKQFADPGYLPGDWYFNLRGPRDPFHVLIYPLTRFFPLVTVSIIGRIIGYLFLSIGLGLVAQRLGLSPMSACVAVGFYFLLGQHILPGQEWIFMRIESKVIAYGFIFLGLYAVMNRRLWLTAVFGGCAASIHVLVGWWGSAALGLTALSFGLGTWPERFRALGMWCAAGSVGIYYALSFLFETRPAAQFDINWIYVYFRNPHHLDPFSWEIKLRDLIFAVPLIWVLAGAGTYFPDRDEPRIAARFALWTLLPYCLGIIASPFDAAPKFLQFYPFRVASTLVPLFGLLIATLAFCRHVLRSKPGYMLMIVGAFMFLISGAVEFADGYKDLSEFPEGALRGGRRATRELYKAGHWIRNNTEPGSLLLASPSLESISYLTQRPVIARYKSVPSGRASIAEWYRRLIDLNGGAEPIKRGFRGAKKIGANFQQLSEEQYLSLAQTYNANYLLVKRRRDLSLDRVFRTEKWDVYAF